MKNENLEGTAPHALRAIRASLFDNRYLRFFQFDCIFRTNADTTSAKVASVRFYLDEQHGVISGISSSLENIFACDGDEGE